MSNDGSSIEMIDQSHGDCCTLYFCKDFRLENLYYIFWKLYIFYADWWMMLIFTSIFRSWGMVFLTEYSDFSQAVWLFLDFIIPFFPNLNLFYYLLVMSSSRAGWSLCSSWRINSSAWLVSFFLQLQKKLIGKLENMLLFFL